MGESDYKQLIADDPDAVAKLLVEKGRQIQLLTNNLINATKSEKLSVAWTA